MNKPLVSIIMNCHNGQKYLYRSIKSILNQKYSNWELIFWDNCSTDQSKKIFFKFTDHRLKYFKSNKFKILYEARNDALKECKGKYISFLDTDDYWFENKLYRQVELLEKNEDIGLVYTNYLTVNMNRFFLKKKKINFSLFQSGKITNFLIKNYFIGLVTIMIRKSLMKGELEYFDSKYNLLSDFDYILRFSKKFNIDFIRDVLAVYNQHQDQLQYKNLPNQAIQFQTWLENRVIKEKTFSGFENFSTIEKKIKFLSFLKDIEKKNIFSKAKDLFFYENNLYKVKLFFLIFFPKKIVEKIFSFN